MAPGVTQGKIADVHMWKGLCISSLPGLRLAGDVPRRRLGDRPHHQLVDVDVRWSGNRPDDAIGDVGAGQRLHALVDRGGPLPVALEADQAEFRLDHPRGDLGHPNRLPHELEPQRLTDGAHGVLARRVADTARINLEPRYRAEVHDMGAGCAPKQREEGFRDPQEADDVRLHHLNPVVIAALGQWLQAGGQPGVVDQHLDLTVFRLDGAREALNAGEIPDVEGEPPSTPFARDRHQPILAAGPEHHPISGAGQASRRGLTDARAGTSHHGDPLGGGHDPNRRPRSSARHWLHPLFFFRDARYSLCRRSRQEARGRHALAPPCACARRGDTPRRRLWVARRNDLELRRLGFEPNRQRGGPPSSITRANRDVTAAYPKTDSSTNPETDAIADAATNAAANAGA